MVNVRTRIATTPAELVFVRIRNDLGAALTEDLEACSVPRVEYACLYRQAAWLVRGRVLDLRSDPRHCACILRASPMVTGYASIDLSRGSLTRAGSGRRCTMPVLAGSVRQLPFADASFDTAVGMEMLAQPDLPAPVIAELRRVLKPGGVLIGSVAAIAVEPEFEDADATILKHPYCFSVHYLHARLGPWFPHVEVLVSRPMLAGIFYTADGRQRHVVQSEPGGRSEGSCLFVAGAEPFTLHDSSGTGVCRPPAEAAGQRRMGHGSRDCRDGEFADIMVRDHRPVEERDQALVEARMVLVAKDALLTTLSERLGDLEGTLDATVRRLQRTCTALEATQDELDRLRSSRGWHLFCRLRNLVRFRHA